MKIHFTHFFSILILSSQLALSQQNKDYQTSRFAIDIHNKVDVSAIKTDWDVQLFNYDNPSEGNKAYSDHIEKIKNEIGKKYPRKEKTYNANKTYNILSPDTPRVITAFEGNLFQNNVPNDNTLAFSDNGMLVSAINCSLYFFDTKNDTLLNHVSLSAFSDTLQLDNNQYDPKLLYDPKAGRFVIVFLSGYTDTTSNIVVGFSQSGDPLGFWNLYYLPGNPLADSSWTDFPAIALTDDELFITTNLLNNSPNWQTAFKQSIIWQVDKNTGYAGQTLQTKLWHNICFGGKPVRNLHPVQGGSGLTGPDIYLLSNRNFAVQSDTIFLLHISNTITGNGATLSVNALLSDRNYGMPPDAKQPANQFLQTNDARILGGFIENDNIQFVGNSMDTLSGFASFYHGIINHVSSSPSVHLTLMSDTLEFGYPNLSYTGIDADNNSSIITVNYTNTHTFPGLTSFYYNGKGEYSQRINLKSGVCYINVIIGHDRWGDYSGSQRIYKEPGKVWVAGTFGKPFHQGNITYKSLGTWIAKLQKPADEIVIPQYFDLLAYPNPVADVIYVEVSIPKDAAIDVSLYDVTGKLIKQLMTGQATAGKNLLSFSAKPLRKGMYFLTIKDSKNIFFTKKIVKG